MGPTTKATRSAFSLRRKLGSLVLACLLPASLVSAWLLYANFKLERTSVEHQTALVARTVLADWERDMASIESALRTLATSQELQSGDLKRFHTRASQALASGIVYNFVLTDVQGRQVLNTLIPPGDALPATGTPPALSAVFEQSVPVLTNLFVGPVTHKPAIAMGVPVPGEGGVRYSLNVGLSPERINQLLARHELPPGWLVAVLDGSGTIVGRSRESARYLGEKAVPELRAAVAQGGSGTLRALTKEGVPVFTAYAHSATWGWSVAVGAPVAVLHQNLLQRLWWTAVGLLLALGGGLWFARSVVRTVVHSVTGLNRAALNLVRDQPVVLPPTQLQEAEAVGEAILQAERVMQRVKFMAQHDALTGLPNRLLFEDFAQRRLALSVRQSRPVVVLAVDLDGFKAVNDTLGHAVGDEVLKTAARRMEDTVRASDMVARIGGDEFVALLYDSNTQAALDTAGRMVAQLSAPYPGVAVPVSASVGVALHQGAGDDFQSLMARADHALYRAKTEGRHRAVLADAPAAR